MHPKSSKTEAVSWENVMWNVWVIIIHKIHREFPKKFEKGLFLYLPSGQPLTVLLYSLTCSSPPLQSFYIYPSEIAGMHWFGADVLAHPPTLWCVMTNLSLLRPIGRFFFFLTSDGKIIKMAVSLLGLPWFNCN